MRNITQNEISTILTKDFTGANNPNILVMVDSYLVSNIINMNITREESSINEQINIIINNINPDDWTDPGYYIQQRNDTANGKSQNEWYHVLQPGKEIIVNAGYGLNVVRIFTGIILTVQNAYYGNDCVTTITGINNGRLLNQGEIVTWDEVAKKRIWNITYPIGADIYEFFLTSTDTNPYLHEIFKDICMRAGISSANILYDTFDLRLNDLDEEYYTIVSGKWINIINSIKKLLNARLFINENNQIELRKNVDLSYSFDGKITLTGTAWTDLTVNANNKDFAIENSIVFDLGYEKDVDWEYDLETNSIKRTDGSTIPSGTPIDVEYNYVNWIFKNGQGLYSLSQRNSHEECYGKVAATNENEDLESVDELGVLGDGSSVNLNLIYREDLPELITQGDLDNWVTDKKSEIQKQYWGAKASIVAVPHLQIHDLVQFIIWGCITGIYKITGFTLTYSPENGFNMSVESTFYSNYNDYE